MSRIRRSLLGITAVLVVSTSLVTSAGASDRANASATRTIATSQGMVTVPRNPQRIVTVDEFSKEAMVDAGLLPVGAPPTTKGYVAPDAWKKLQHVPDSTGTTYTPDLEAIAAMHPDVILGINDTQDLAVYKQLSAIAPTVLFNYVIPNEWAVLDQEFANAVNRLGTIKKVEAKYDAEAKAIRTTYKAELKRYTFGAAIGSTSNFRLYEARSNAGKIILDAGGHVVPGMPGQGDLVQTLSFEDIGPALQKADIILTYGSTSGAVSPIDSTLTAQANWQTLPAVTSHHVYGSLIVPDSYSDAIVVLNRIKTILASLEAGR